MALRAGEKGYFTFVKGLNTEASPFTFPPDTSAEEDNFELLVNGARRRRLGLDYEASYVNKNITSTPMDSTLQAITHHDWRSAGGNSSTNFSVVQTGKYLRFYVNDAVMSATLHEDIIDLSVYKTPSATTAQVELEPVSTASGKGYLFVVSKYLEPIYLIYDEATDAISASIFVCKLREFTRIDDGLETVNTPSTLSDEHRYNLYNQGWSAAGIDLYKALPASVYPSNAHVMALGWGINGSTGQRTFRAAEINNYESGNSPAPNGHLITGVFDTNTVYDSPSSYSVLSRTYNSSTLFTIETKTPHELITGGSVSITESSFSYHVSTGSARVWGSLNGTHTVTVLNATTFTIPVHLPDHIDSDGASTVDGLVSGFGKVNTNTLINPEGVVEAYRFETVVFYAGRVWFAGINSTRISTRLFYSQTLVDDGKIGRFLQEADPTAEEDSAVVDTDGGYLVIPEMGKVSKMEVLANKLVVFTTQGAYAVGGSAEDYFKATSFSVNKIIDITSTSPRSTVNVDGALLAFAKQGIYQFANDPTTGTVVGTSISQDTIQTLFSEIPEACLPHVAGIYDDTYKRVVWTYSLNSTYPKIHTKCLVLDLRLKAWYVYTIPSTTSVYISGAAVVRTATTRDKKIKFFTVDSAANTITWSDLTNTSWKDFYTRDSVGVDAAAYLVTGHELHGDTMRKKQVPYMFVYCKRSETQWISTGLYSVDLDPQSSCMVQFWWDFSDSIASNKVGVAFQAYRYNRLYIPPSTTPPVAFDPGYNMITTKNKIRGVGKVFQVKFSTETGKDLYLYGWNTTFTGGSEV